MELTQLKYFVSLAKYQHFTKAANELFISQPSLSKAISKLEDELGVKLFDRDKKAVYLNECGRVLQEYAEKMLIEETEARSKLQDMNAGLLGKISIAASFPIEPPGPLSNYINEFFLSYPGISFHVFLLNEDTIRDMLINREIDFSFSVADIDVPESVAIEIFTSRIGVVMSKEHPLALRTGPLSVYELKNENFVCTNSLYNVRDSIYYICRLAGFEPTVVFEGGNSEITGKAMRTGRGVSLASEEMFRYRREREQPENIDSLVFKHIKEDFSKRVIRISYLRNRYYSTAMRSFFKGIMKEFGKPEIEMQSE